MTLTEPVGAGSETGQSTVPLDAGKLADNLLARLRDVVRFDIGCLFLEDDKDGHLHLLGALCDGVPGLEDMTCAGWVIDRRLEPGPGEYSLEGHHEVTTSLEALGVSACTWAPLTLAGGVRALVLMADRDADRRAEREAADLEGLYREIGFALDSVNLSRREKRRVRQLKALLEVSRAVAETYDISVLMEKTLESINRSFGASMSHVLVYNKKEELKSVILEIGGRLERLEVGMRDRLQERSREKGVAALAKKLSEVSFAKLLDSHNPVMGIPVRVDGKTLAVIKCSLSEYMATDEIDMEFLSSLANQLAAGLQNIANHAELQERNNDLALLNKIADNLNSKVNDEDALEYVGIACRDIFNAETVFFGRVSEGHITWTELAPVLARRARAVQGGKLPWEPNGGEHCRYLSRSSLALLGLEGSGVLACVGEGIDALGYLLIASEDENSMDLETASRILRPIAGYLYACLMRVGFYTQANLERAKLSAVFNAMCDAVVVADDRDRFLAVNAEAERIFGIDGAEVTGLPVFETLGLNELEEFITSEDGESGVVEKEIIVPVHPPRHTRAYLSSVHRPDGTRVGKVAVLRDVTMEKQLENMKSDFLACVSHELNTPLTLVLASAQTLCCNWERMGESVKLELLDSITVGADRLNSLIKDILALTDASSGIAFCTKSVVDAARIVGEALERCRLHDDSHDYVVDLNDGDYTCEVDEHRIRSALLYVLDNARKFSSPGTRIKVSLEGDEECVHVSVTDQGIGISQWHLANIFDKFTQVDCGDTRPAAGTGNGLYLAREIVRRHEGDIYVTSEPGVGSTFRITLPRSGVFNGKGLIH